MQFLIAGYFNSFLTIYLYDPLGRNQNEDA